MFRPTQVRKSFLPVRGYHPFRPTFPDGSSSKDKRHWPGPRSLATTNGVSVDVLSSGYLDVSVPQVRFIHLCIQCMMTLRSGFPIRKSMDQSLLTAPHGLSQRATSFIASQRQGIHQMPLRHLIVLITTMRQPPCSRCACLIWFVLRSVDRQIAKAKRRSKRSISYSNSIYPTNTGGCMRYTRQLNSSRTNQIAIVAIMLITLNVTRSI